MLKNIAKFFQPDPAQAAVPTDHLSNPPLDIAALEAAQVEQTIIHEPTVAAAAPPTAAVAEAAPAEPQRIEEYIEEPASDDHVPLVEATADAAVIDHSDDATVNLTDPTHQEDEVVLKISHDA